MHHYSYTNVESPYALLGFRRSPFGARIVLVLLTSLTCWTAAAGDEVDFVRDVRPILQQYCYECHGEDKQKSGLRLDIKSEAFKGGDGWGPSIVAGHADDSPLTELVTSDDDDLRMPPEGSRVTASEVAILRRWIDAGAVWPNGVDLASVEDRRDHWSFHPLPLFDSFSDDSPSRRHSIDSFIDEELAANRLERNPPADPKTLVRRMYLDLIGLPPTPEQVAAFVRNADPADLANRLLASPRYGERWAQHWLDVIRWAETVGFETNAERRDAWHYRDWVIAALNNDKPYDQFILEQIAGDTVGEDAALGFLVAGPANLPGQIGRDEAAMRSARQDELDEVVRTVSQSLFGLTIGCARCHDHKFDPITQRDYYSMQAVFSGLQYGTRRLRGPKNDDWTAQLPDAQTQAAELAVALEALRDSHGLRPALADVHTESFTPITATAVRVRIDATTTGAAASLYELEVWSADSPSTNVALASSGAIPSASSYALANQSRHFDNLVDGTVDKRQAYPWVSASGGAAWVQVDFASPTSIDRVVLHRGSSMPAELLIEARLPESNDWHEVVHTRDRLPRVDDNRKADTVELYSGDKLQLSDQEVVAILDLLRKVRAAEANVARLAAGPQVYAARFNQPDSETRLMHRGDAMQPRAVVPATMPEFLGKLDENLSESETRVALARHLTRPQHPLTARVIVNRVWQHHFGSGLVDTPSDFGHMGTSPTHPELLDWLAAWFVNEGWSLKKLHHLIVTSETYAQSSAPQADGLAIDAESRLLWRYPPRRIEAEAIRDSILHVSGKLNLATGGRGFSLFNQRGGLADYRPKETFDQTGWRRMVYAHKVRMIPVDVFGAFDCPDAGQMKPKRTRSITPVQSLGLLNSPFIVRQSEFFAERVTKDVGDVPAKQVERAFQLAFSRSPNAAERKQVVELVTRHGLPAACRAILNTSEFAWIQ
ncbi:MAG: DUF1553 domain-containing protein [Aureliella sp.]